MVNPFLSLFQDQILVIQPKTIFFHSVDPRGVTKGGLAEFPTPLDIVCRFGTKGCLDHRFRVPLAYTVGTAQLLPLYINTEPSTIIGQLINLADCMGQQQSSTQATLGTVSHQSTNQAQHRLTSVMVRERVYPS